MEKERIMGVQLLEKIKENIKSDPDPAAYASVGRDERDGCLLFYGVA